MTIESTVLVAPFSKMIVPERKFSSGKSPAIFILAKDLPLFVFRPFSLLYPAELRTRTKTFTTHLSSALTALMAEREGFEPSVRINVRFLSRELVSATHPPLHNEESHSTRPGR